MTNVQFTFPKLKLTSQLRQPGGPAVAEALQAAKANLDAIAPECLSELAKVTNEAIACFQGFPETFSREALDALYAIAARAIGVGEVCGAPTADVAFISLCDLIDHFTTSGRWDLEAIAVHVQTLQLLVLRAGQETDAATTKKILVGLRKVSARYARDQADSGTSD